MEFALLPIPQPILTGVLACGFTRCTPIQAMTLPLTLAGKDVAGQAQTGTGKTAAFLIATFTRLFNEPRRLASQEGCGAPRALIVAPTRELVVQIEAEAQRVGQNTSFNIVAVYGGVDYEKQRQKLTSGHVDILVGTPGRLIDYFKQHVYHVKAVEVLVIDEADRLFDMGFIEDLRYLLKRLPPYDQRLSMLFSATLSYRAQELSFEYMNMPVNISTAMEVRTVEKVAQTLYHVEGTRKISLLVGMLKKMLPELPPPPPPVVDVSEDEEMVEGVEAVEEEEITIPVDGKARVMIFTNTKRMGETLLNWLGVNGIACEYLSGDVPQAKRLRVLRQFQAGEMPVLIATDVAGRGLHIDAVTHVINYDLPENAEDYVHRIGRTARAGAEGCAITLVDEEGAYNLEAVEAFIGMKIPVQWVEDDGFAELVRPPRLPRKPFEGRKELPRRGRSPGRSGQGSSSVVPVVTSPPVIAAADSAKAETTSPARRRRRRRRSPQDPSSAPPAALT
ncbi:MAG: DEAD/DEAH box helicase [Magnetococcales bacterium]|nr:DEAD/DEAH box helicase [Magnetococcales bacterium]